MNIEDDNPVFSRDVASTGIPGLDLVLRGGFTRDRLYLVEGLPGTGKTTLALQFPLVGPSLPAARAARRRFHDDRASDGAAR